MTPFEIFLVSLVGVLFAGFIAEEIRLRLKTKRLIEGIVKLTMDVSVLENELAQTPLTPTETEGFIKFLSESREWAFTFIEDVQAALQDLKAAMEKNDEQGITKSYEKLMTFLPEKINND